MKNCGYCTTICTDEVSCELCLNDYYCNVECRSKHVDHTSICGKDVSEYNTRVTTLIDKINRDYEALTKILSNKKRIGIIIYVEPENTKQKEFMWHPVDSRLIKFLKHSYTGFIDNADHWQVTYKLLRQIQQSPNIQYYFDLTGPSVIATSIAYS